MLKRPLWMIGIAAVWIALLIAPAAAQDEANPLLDLLALVPDTAETWDAAPLVSYADYRAIETARGIDTPTAQDFADRTELSRLWMAATNGIASGLPLNYFMAYLEGMETIVGFSWFDIDRALTFGQPPAMGKVLAGDFDAEQIGAAFAARDYTQDTSGDITIWCPANGCDAGQETNLRTRDPANPFGGELGRSELVATLPGLLLNSPDNGVLTAMIETQQDAPSLADNPLFQAAADALQARGTVRQAVFFSVTDVGFGYALPDMLNSEPDTFAGYGTLPPYLLMVVADVVSDVEEGTYIGLVYGDVETAQAGAEELAARIEMAQSARAGQPFMTLIEERGGTVEAATLHDDAERGLAVALLEITKALPTNEPQQGDTEEFFEPSSQLFRLLIQSVYARDLPVVGLDVNSTP